MIRTFESWTELKLTVSIYVVAVWMWYDNGCKIKGVN